MCNTESTDTISNLNSKKLIGVTLLVYNGYFKDILLW